MKLGKSSLNDIAKLRIDSIKRQRISSYDKSGDNRDWIDIEPQETAILGEGNFAGCITHIWCTFACRSKYALRNAIIRMYWDGEKEKKPSVEAPLGDFFGQGHAKHKEFVSLPLQMSPQGGKGLNCWWPMPFSEGFRITLENDNQKRLRLYYYIDLEKYEQGLDNEQDFGRFHVQWRRENPPPVKKMDDQGNKITKLNPNRFNLFGVKNTEPLKYNYRILEAKGKGHFAGCHLNIDNRTFMPWWIN
ncbi:MAG: glycoside hydrolase family 172 protein, partial [Promethearchaeia archaeon]